MRIILSLTYLITTIYALPSPLPAGNATFTKESAPVEPQNKTGQKQIAIAATIAGPPLVLATAFAGGWYLWKRQNKKGLQKEQPASSASISEFIASKLKKVSSSRYEAEGKNEMGVPPIRNIISPKQPEQSLSQESLPVPIKEEETPVSTTESPTWPDTHSDASLPYHQPVQESKDPATSDSSEDAVIAPVSRTNDQEKSAFHEDSSHDDYTQSLPEALISDTTDITEENFLTQKPKQCGMMDPILRKALQMLVESASETDTQLSAIVSELNEQKVIDVLTSGTNNILTIDGPLDNAAYVLRRWKRKDTERMISNLRAFLLVDQRETTHDNKRGNTLAQAFTYDLVNRMWRVVDDFSRVHNIALRLSDGRIVLTFGKRPENMVDTFWAAFTIQPEYTTLDGSVKLSYIHVAYRDTAPNTLKTRGVETFASARAGDPLEACFLDPDLVR